ncbi:MAG TPA: nicotinate (nicotinamide) nucleotide adenylyltransferase [Flavobacteriaceae bacterium]|nr:nicotinate (nicotinamide) nucleotide adenylyltransferase [Flavobacteriaceae bacterium]
MSSKRQVGLYFGTFNPIHVGHVIIANHLVEYSDLDEIWFVVTPMSPHKTKDRILDNIDRYDMVKIAIEDYEKLHVSDIEFHLPKPNYTVTTLVHLEERHPNTHFSLIMGEDNLKSLHRWHNFETIIANYTILVYPRIAHGEIDESIAKNVLKVPQPQGFKEFEANIQFVEAPIIELSSSFIRNAIKEGKNVLPMLDKNVWEWIDKNQFYH